jgi:hypothetical protein
MAHHVPRPAPFDFIRQSIVRTSGQRSIAPYCYTPRRAVAFIKPVEVVSARWLYNPGGFDSALICDGPSVSIRRTRTFVNGKYLSPARTAENLVGIVREPQRHWDHPFFLTT